MAEQKTNVMRLLEQKKIKYTAHGYPHGDEAVDGVTVAKMTGQDPARVFKTLVARGASKRIYVFVIPVTMELELKKAAKAAGEKSVAMIHVSELNGLTGYVRGGCSPIGMKKLFPSFYHSSITEQETIMVSAGKIGAQVELRPEDLISLTRGKIADIAAKG
ncbi:MAG: Cys-tRNA(Pro) deacylase [Oscillospiraceae bacterium]|nr:Cys-tRNA(Pro) deacylase [Oscillospiraceae bacterium]